MQKMKTSLLSVLLALTMVIALIVPSTVTAYAASDKTIVFKSQLVYDEIVKQLNSAGATITSQNASTYTLVLPQTSIDRVKQFSLIYLGTATVELDLSGLENFTSIQSLCIIGGSNISGKSNKMIIKNLEPVGKLTQIFQLQLDQVVVSDGLDVIGELNNLQNVSLEGLSNLDTKVLLNKSKLTRLLVYGCDLDNEDMKNIGTLTSLKDLYLGGPNMEGNNISDISALKNLTNLQYLGVDNNRITDISVVKNFSKLNELSIRCNQIRDLSPLANLTNLQYLRLGRDRYNGSQEGNPISSMDPIKNLNLRRLEASCCGITDISFVKSLPDNMFELDLSGNSIQDFSPLEGKTISSLDISGQDYYFLCPYRGWVDIPSLMRDVMTEGTEVYDSNAYYYTYGCEVSSDNKKVRLKSSSKEGELYIYGMSGGINGSCFTIKLNEGYTGLAELNGEWVYVENGNVRSDFNGFVPNDAGWWCVAGGKVAFGYTGLWYDANVGWWYVENGAINFGYNGFVPNDTGWWCVCGGRVVFEYTGLWYDANVGWWYVENGAINFGYNGFIPNDTGWWCVCGGRVVFEYTGLWYDPYVGWWYVENGAINFGYSGNVLYDGNWYQVVNGKLI